MEIFLLFYIVSIILCWFGIRALYKAEEWDVEPFWMVVIFIPVVNFIVSATVLMIYLSVSKKAKKIANKFFKVK